MPLYEYRCLKCGKRFERIQRFSDPPRSTCPQCGGYAERLISAPAFQFKGTGWYATDYARKSSTPEKPKSESTSASEEKKTTASSKAVESKSASE